MTTRTVVVAGAGAAGALTAAHLADAAHRSGGIRIVLADPAREDGRGVAYSTADGRHLLNVPAGRMSAWPGDPGHFAAWLGTGAGHFAARGEYGRYLAGVLDRAVAQPGVEFVRVPSRVTRAGRGHVSFAGGDSVPADDLVLATGSAAPCTGWAPPALAGSPRFVADPWAPGALDRVSGQSVLLVGTGLTMVDVALTLASPGRRIHAISRHGLLPSAHASGPLPAMPPPSLPGGPLSLRRLRTAVLGHVAASRATHGDWRPAIDSLRPVTADLWGRLSLHGRAEFLRTDLRHWEVRRHRMAPATGDRLRSLLAGGSLDVAADAVRDFSAAGEVLLASGRTTHATAVVNCTGPRCDLGTSTDPLLRQLLGSGLARPGPLGIGLDTGPDGRILGRSGGTPRLWTLGSTRRGQLWECTAIPEIRSQAAALAQRLVPVACPTDD
jgi:uncharacterized NAD(P)/FAD-binding protein YdhS